MSVDYSPTGRWRHRCVLLDEKETLVLQIEESRTRGYGYSETESRWRDASVTDLAIPSQLVSRQSSQWHETMADVTGISDIMRGG